MSYERFQEFSRWMFRWSIPATFVSLVSYIYVLGFVTFDSALHKLMFASYAQLFILVFILMQLIIFSVERIWCEHIGIDE